MCERERMYECECVRDNVCECVRLGMCACVYVSVMVLKQIFVKHVSLRTTQYWKVPGCTFCDCIVQVKCARKYRPLVPKRLSQFANRLCTMYSCLHFFIVFFLTRDFVMLCLYSVNLFPGPSKCFAELLKKNIWLESHFLFLFF